MANKDTIEFNAFVDATLDVDDSQSRLIAAIEEEPGFTIDRVERIKPFGMTGAEIAISFVISLASSALVHVARDRIDDAAKRVSGAIKKPLRVVFKRKELGKNDLPGDSNEPNDPETMPGGKE